VGVRVHEARADHAFPGEFDHLALARRHVDGPDGGDRLFLDQHVRGHCRVTDAVGNQAAAEQDPAHRAGG
jgi:hypothetical protein